MVTILEKYDNGVAVFEIKNEDMVVQVSNYGCTIMKILVKDRNNQPTDVVLGFSSIDEYIKKNDKYLGAVVGRVANRIAKGNFVLNGKEYQLTINNGPNTNHGGLIGFSFRIFDYEILENGIRFHYLSKDGEENFPGNLDFTVTYILEGRTLKLQYHATCDQDTLINITNHSYFNLSGVPCNIDEHTLQVKADKMVCVDSDGMANGIIKDVKDTPFDFMEPTLIGEHIYKEDEQLQLARGYDHPFIFHTKENQVKLYSKKSGIELTVSTSLPQAQIYSANWLEGEIGKQGLAMNERSALCVETQNMPDSIHLEENPSVILKQGESYDEETIFKFGVR